MTESERFRKLLEKFYNKVSTGPQLNVFKKILTDELDEVEVEPIHILTLTQEPSFKEIPEKKKIGYANKAECLYKNSDFASVFLFGFLLEALKRGESEYFKEIEARIESNLELFYRQETAEDAIRYKFLLKGIIEFCHSLLIRSFRPQQIEKLLKAFYNSTIERKGVKKTERERYGTEAQVILSFILGEGGYFPSKKEVTDHTSDAYECNTINFCINIQNVMEREEWTIGEGENIINIVMEKNEFSVYEDAPAENEIVEEPLNDDWLKILGESKKIKDEQSEKTSRILTDLNIAPSHSPSKSMRSPKSANYNGLRKSKNNFI